jgi:hypothetical protein
MGFFAGFSHFQEQAARRQIEGGKVRVWLRKSVDR